MTDKEKIERLWEIVNELIEHIACGLNISEQLDEFLDMGMSEKFLTALGYDEGDVGKKIAEMDFENE